jgi:lipopolysaccharide export system permease protein
MIRLIWERYFLKEILKVFALFLFGFFFLYAAIDYSLHMQDFLKDKSIQVGDLFAYYGFQFVKRAALLFPLALLIATVKVLTTLSSHRELVALQVSGLPIKKLLRPFFLVAGLCTLFNILSYELFLPKSLSYLDTFYDKHLRRAKEGKDKHEVHSFTLKNSTKLIYQTYHKNENFFFDVIWLKSSNEIWRMKTLTATPENPQGKHIDRLVRNSQGFFEKKESFDTRVFKEISWEKELHRKGFIPFENRSVSELFSQGYLKKTPPFMKMEMLTQFYYKCTMPLLSIVVIIAVAPFCVRYSRKTPVFLLYSASLFGFIGFFTLMDAAVILGENRVVSPPLAVLVPFLVCSVPFIRNFVRQK